MIAMPPHWKTPFRAQWSVHRIARTKLRQPAPETNPISAASPRYKVSRKRCKSSEPIAIDTATVNAAPNRISATSLI